MKVFKVAGIAFGLTLALLAGAAIYVVIAFDEERIKAELAKSVKAQNQRILRIDGDLRWTLWPDLGLRAEKVSLSERGGEKAFAAIESVHVSVATKPLFSKQVVVNAFEIEGARVALVRFEDGTLNIDDLLPKGEKKTPLKIEAASLRIADAALSWKDEKGGGSANISGLDLATGRVLADTGRLSFNLESIDLSVRIGADVGAPDLRLKTPRIAYAEGRAALEKLAGELGIAHPAAPGKRLRLPFEGRLHADMPEQSAKAALQLRLDESRAALKLDVIRFSPPAFRFDLDIDRLNVDKYQPKGKKTAKGGDANLSALKRLDARGTIRIGDLQVSNVKAANVRLDFDARDGLKGQP